MAAATSLTPPVRQRMRTQLVERLKTPIDPPSGDRTGSGGATTGNLP